MFSHRYVSPNCDANLQKRFCVEFLEELSQLYEVEKMCLKLGYPFEHILLMDLQYECFDRL